ncbi:MAG TPA: anthranilate phosphoribosyltransferase [Flavobacteriales bacterium]
MKKLFEQLYAHQPLSSEQAREVLIAITEGAMNPAQIASFLTVYLMRPLTVEELEGFRNAMLELAVPFEAGRFCMDLCGTGGDSKNTFNISTLSSLVVAASGINVTKHGNYGVSSISGSSNVMEYFGYQFTNNPETLLRQLDRCNICFLHAPLFHPAMKSVAPIRKELGVKTFFNMLGPLTNPAKPAAQCTGVFNLQVARLYHYLLEKENKQYTIIHSLDGYDEISLTSNVRLLSHTGESILNPIDFNSEKLLESDLFGGHTIEESASLFINILEGKGTAAQVAAVSANAGMAIKTAKPQESLSDCIEQARELLQSGRAKEVFKQLLAA